MFKKKIKNKIIFFLFKSINNIKKKNFLILGPVGNYSYNIIIKKINKKIFCFSLLNIKSLYFNFKKIIPHENNNGGIVRDSLNLLLNKKNFINTILILNIKHNFFLYNNKKKFNLHIQSYKQSKKKIFFIFKKMKIMFSNSNSNINNGVNICNFFTKKIFPINVKNIKLKDNFINKTKFIITNNFFFKKYIISIFTNKYYFLKNFLTIYKKNNFFYYEIFFNSLRNFLFIMKNIKKKIKILFVGFFNII